MKSRFIKVVLLLTARFVFFFGPSVAYNYMDPRSEFSPIADQLRQLSVYHEHNHASFSNAEHRRHYEAFDFDIPYQALKPKVQAMFTGPGWKREEGADFIQYQNLGEGRVLFVRIAKNQDVGITGEVTDKPTGAAGLHPWAVVMFQNTWFDRFMFDLGGHSLFFSILSPYSCGYCFVVLVVLLLLAKKPKVRQLRPPDPEGPRR